MSGASGGAAAVVNLRGRETDLAARHETVLVLDFGSQYPQLIARRLRENRVYCEVHPPTMSAREAAASVSTRPVTKSARTF